MKEKKKGKGTEQISNEKMALSEKIINKCSKVIAPVQPDHTEYDKTNSIDTLLHVNHSHQYTGLVKDECQSLRKTFSSCCRKSGLVDDDVPFFFGWFSTKATPPVLTK